MTFHMPADYYDPPEYFECELEHDPCTCLEDAEDAHEQHLIDQEEARRDEEEDWHDTHNTA